MKFRELLEEYKFIGKIKPYEKILYNAYIDFLNDYYDTSLNIEISFRQPSKKLYFGWVDLISMSRGKYKIIVEYKPSSLPGKIAHEFHHCAQYKKGELSFNETNILWKNKAHISIKELSEITDFNTYKQLPWEAEAYLAQDKLPSLFKKSKFYNELKGKDKTLDFLIDSDAIII